MAKLVKKPSFSSMFKIPIGKKEPSFCDLLNDDKVISLLKLAYFHAHANPDMIFRDVIEELKQEFQFIKD